MNNLSSYCGLVDAKVRASDKDLPVTKYHYFFFSKLGACIGHFQMIIAGREERQSLVDVVQLLKNTSNPQVDHIIKVMKKWAKDNRISL